MWTFILQHGIRSPLDPDFDVTALPWGLQNVPKCQVRSGGTEFCIAHGGGNRCCCVDVHAIEGLSYDDAPGVSTVAAYSCNPEKKQ